MEFITANAAEPFLLTESGAVYMVQSGRVEVYVVRLENGVSAGRRRNLFTAEPGQALFGLPPSGQTGLLACGADGAELLKRESSILLDTAYRRQDTLFAEPVLFMAESWILTLWAALVRQALPTRFKALAAGNSLTVSAGTMIRPDEEILWVTVKQGAVRFCGRSELTISAGSGWFPLTSDTWLEADGDTELTACHSVDLLDFARDPQSETLWQGLDYFHRLALTVLTANEAADREAGQQRLAARANYDARLVQQSFVQLTALGRRAHDSIDCYNNIDSSLLTACRKVAAAQGIDPHGLAEPPGRQSVGIATAVSNIADAGHFRVRQVLLRGRWYEEDNGPLLAFLGEDSAPVALVPSSSQSYVLVNPAAGGEETITDKLAAKLQPYAYMFYRPLPEGDLSPGRIIRFALASASRQDLIMLVLMAAAGGLLSMAAPLATGMLFDTVIPSADRTQHGILIALLVTGALAGLAFQITRSAALVRTEAKINTAVQAAVWDRLLNLPVTFFRQFTAGDLANRANGINMIRQLLSGAAMSSAFAGITAAFNLALLFYYSIKLALVACGLVLIFCIVFALFATLEIRYKQQLIQMEGKITGAVLQIIGGISKFRVAAAENRAYYLWAREFGIQRGAAFQSRKIAAYQTIVNAAWPTVISLVVFYTVMKLAEGETPLKMADFLAFNSALAAFTSGAISLTVAFMSITDIFPLYERVKPILQAVPEVDESKLDPGSLTGEIEVSRLQFRYHRESEPVLKHVSLQIKRGQFVAVVGSSGSGKSTLLRLLLGFEKPEAGGVYYDGQELSALNIRAVRSQFGVVLQNGQLMAGDIFTNITGSLNLTLSDAWEAAEMAGVADDIRAMPMGMHTVIAEGASTISGGQRQRILIARAIVNRPRIIFFDEATSALDNRTQAIVSASLEKLKATRIVIAHRLSTVKNADKIFVMDKGRIVESGTYDELMELGGMFASLAKRQIA